MNKDIEPVDIDALQKLYDASTPGKWFAYRSMIGPTVQIAAGWLFQASAKGTDADSEFVAAARNAMPALLTEVRSLRQKISERDAKHPWNVFKERDELQQSHENSVAEERRLRLLHQQEFSRAEIALEELAAAQERERVNRELLSDVGIRLCLVISEFPTMNACCRPLIDRIDAALTKD